jgi:hypothetical protein
MRIAHLALLLTALAACQRPAPGALQRALTDDGGAQFESPPQDNVDPFQKPSVSPLVAARLHSCEKVPYETLGRLLASRGVNLAAVANKGQLPTAGQLYAAAGPTMGAPNFATRSREITEQTTSGATKSMDVFLMAAPEIVAAMPSLKVCQVGGQPTQMFDPNTGACTAAGILCLTGAPASPGQVDLCNQLLKDVPGPVGQQIAVATILSAAHTCQ